VRKFISKTLVEKRRGASRGIGPFHPNNSLQECVLQSLTWYFLPGSLRAVVVVDLLQELHEGPVVGAIVLTLEKIQDVEE
jgi:hypothetical protein